MRKCSATCGVLSARLSDSRASPTFSAASQIFLHSPFTIRSIAARTFFEILFGALGGTMGAGASSAASARLAGILSGVAFFMIALSALARPPQRTKRHVFTSGGMASPSRKVRSGPGTNKINHLANKPKPP